MTSNNTTCHIFQQLFHTCFMTLTFRRKIEINILKNPTINPRNPLDSPFMANNSTRNPFSYHLVNFNNLWIYEMSSTASATKHILESALTLFHTSFCSAFIEQRGQILHTSVSVFNSFIRVVSEHNSTQRWKRWILWKR